jgi:hypothetical protein
MIAVLEREFAGIFAVYFGLVSLLFGGKSFLFVSSHHAVYRVALACGYSPKVAISTALLASGMP